VLCPSVNVLDLSHNPNLSDPRLLSILAALPQLKARPPARRPRCAAAALGACERQQRNHDQHQQQAASSSSSGT